MIHCARYDGGMTVLNLTKPATLGELLALTRGIVGLDQTAMGARVGASRPTVSAWERGAREPSFSQVVTWARITGQPVSVFADALNAETAPTEVEAVLDVSRAWRDSNPQPSDSGTVGAGRFWSVERSVALAELWCGLDIEPVTS